MPDENDPNEATTTAETLHRHGDPDPSKWEKAEAVTDRPNDLQKGGVSNSTLAGRAAANKKRGRKVVDGDDAENKAVQSAVTKAPRARKSAK